MKPTLVKTINEISEAAFKHNANIEVTFWKHDEQQMKDAAEYLKMNLTSHYSSDTGEFDGYFLKVTTHSLDKSTKVYFRIYS